VHVVLRRAHLLVGVHVNRPRGDYLKEQQGPVSGPLGAPLHCVKHPSYLQQDSGRSAFFLQGARSTPLLQDPDTEGKRGNGGGGGERKRGWGGGGRERKRGREGRRERF
jgi:hypothetical protein